MSGMLPQEVVNSYRLFNDVSIEVYGNPCTLYIPSNLNSVEVLDTFAKPADYTFTSYSTKVWIDWSPNKHQLHKLGIFAEDETPMLAYFSNTIKDEFGNAADIDVTIRSYFSLTSQFIAGNTTATNEFEIVDVVAVGMANKLFKKCYKIAPRRVQPNA